MKPILPLFVFIDACGWEIVRDRAFLDDLAPHRRRLRSVFGYSSACIPSILSGRWPAETRNWCYFVHDPARSPFRPLRPLGWLPSAVTGRRVFRRWLSKLVRGPLGFRGYFDLYNLPFRHVGRFDFTEKKNPLQPGGMNAGTNIFDVLADAGIPYHVSEPGRGEAGNLAALEADVAAERVDFAFLYWPELDGLMHRVGNDSPAVPAKLARYAADLGRLVALAQRHYAEVRLHVFSDHGMANCTGTLDLRRRLRALPVRMPDDYAVVYDSTMARFWFFNERARREVTSCLGRVPEGRILSDAELRELGTFFPDRYFGELIFLVEEGVLIVPSDMGERPLAAMHGYHPDAPQSYAALLTNREDIPAGLTAIPHLYDLMRRDAFAAHAANRSRAVLRVPEAVPA
ncbi:MAG TPA: alkaline phosphatase family protein [Opitutaceae bacterium]|nr:alkaline phosphatase family protein [Opitutaceae bacterium]